MSRTTRTPSLSPWFAKLFSGKPVTRSSRRGFRPTSGAPRTTITPLGTLPGARIPSPGAGEPARRVWWAGAAGERSGRRRRGAHRALRKITWLYLEYFCPTSGHFASWPFVWWGALREGQRVRKGVSNRTAPPGASHGCPQPGTQQERSSFWPAAPTSTPRRHPAA